MELSFTELKKRDVINMSDGRCLGRITDIVFDFPEGKLQGIIVPNSNCRFSFFRCTSNDIFIEERQIKKIGNDVILVDLKYGEVCPPDNKGRYPRKKNHCPPPCPPPCPQPCPPPCPPPRPPSCPPPCPPSCPPKPFPPNPFDLCKPNCQYEQPDRRSDCGYNGIPDINAIRIDSGDYE